MSSIIQAVGMGKFGDNSHPVHPATVHLPIAFLLTSHFLVLLNYTLQSLPSLKSLPYSTPLIAHIFDANPELQALPNILPLLTNLCTLAGLLTSLPAVTTGVIELTYMYKANGLSAKTKTTLFHAALNDLVLIGSLYTYLTAHSAHFAALTRADRDAKVFGGRPATTAGEAASSAGMIAVLVAAAYLGGKLVYGYGVGVQRMGEGKRIKEGKVKAG